MLGSRIFVLVGGGGVGGGGGVVVQGWLLENSLILFDDKGLFGLFGVLVNLFEGVVILFFTGSGV